MSEQILSFKFDEIIIGGDFHLVLDVLKDKTGGKPTTRWNSLEELKYIQDNLDLTDRYMERFKPRGKKMYLETESAGNALPSRFLFG